MNPISVMLYCEPSKMELVLIIYVLATWIRPNSRWIQSRIRRSAKEMFYLKFFYVQAISKSENIFRNILKWGASIAERFNNIGCAFWWSNWSNVCIFPWRSKSNNQNCKSLLSKNARRKYYPCYYRHSNYYDSIR